MNKTERKIGGAIVAYMRRKGDGTSGAMKLSSRDEVATYCSTDESGYYNRHVSVHLHGYTIATVDECNGDAKFDTVWLCAHGWYTLTTCRRMNAVLEALGIAFCLARHNGRYCLYRKGEGLAVTSFRAEDSLEFQFTGGVLSGVVVIESGAYERVRKLA